MVDALGLLQSVAPDYGATLHAVPKGGEAVITVVRPGGSAHTFHLALTFDAEHVSVRAVPGQTTLPAFCPDRHINSDGSFCLGWGEDNPSKVIDEAAAKRWWAAVYQFLTRQVGANLRGVFPGTEHGRAHGDAARHQARAEKAAASLGSAFVQHLLEGKFTVRKDGRPGQHRLELWCDNKRIARVSTQSKMLVGGYTRCPCDAAPAREIAGCGDHASVLANFILELHSCAMADRKFVDDLAAQGAVCCETLQTCGLRQAIKRKQSVAPKKGGTHARRSKYWRPPSKSK